MEKGPAGEGLTKTGERLIYLAMGLMLLASGFLTAKGVTRFVLGTDVEEKEEYCIVIDAGHGGGDPGKVGVNNALEKDVNLQVAKRLESLLKQEGVRTVMTRTGDEGLYDTDADNKKVQDMKRRIGLIEKEKPALVVSIHQNSYPEEYVKGAQVFYYKDSADSRAAAEKIQQSLKTRIDPENHREAKSNSTYYLLKKTPVPTVIVECGFLSNYEEAEKLITPEYQEKMAWAVFMGIMQILNERHV